MVELISHSPFQSNQAPGDDLRNVDQPRARGAKSGFRQITGRPTEAAFKEKCIQRRSIGTLGMIHDNTRIVACF